MNYLDGIFGFLKDFTFTYRLHVCLYWILYIWNNNRILLSYAK